MLRKILDPRRAKFGIRKLKQIGFNRESKILTGHCQGGMLSSAIEIQELFCASYCHQNGWYLLKMEACSTMSYNSSEKENLSEYQGAYLQVLDNAF